MIDQEVGRKWLADRKGRTLSYDDINRYRKVVTALGERGPLMAEIELVLRSGANFAEQQRQSLAGPCSKRKACGPGGKKNPLAETPASRQGARKRWHYKGLRVVGGESEAVGKLAEIPLLHLTSPTS